MYPLRKMTRKKKPVHVQFRHNSICFCCCCWFFLLFWHRSVYVAQAGLKLMIFLLQPPKCQDWRWSPTMPSSRHDIFKNNFNSFTKAVVLWLKHLPLGPTSSHGHLGDQISNTWTLEDTFKPQHQLVSSFPVSPHSCPSCLQVSPPEG
jgi:hypothetical protein